MEKFLFVFLTAVATTVYASEHKMGQQVAPNGEFDRLKTLVGNWEGTHKTPTGEEKVPLTYALTSGGTALEEKLFTGDPHEMVTMYHPEGKTVAMTHYCTIGNQPEMKLEKEDKDSMSFNFVRGSNMSSKNDPHMHSLKLTWISPNELTQTWTFYEKGKPVNTEVFTFKRK